MTLISSVLAVVLVAVVVAAAASVVTGEHDVHDYLHTKLELQQEQRSHCHRRHLEKAAAALLLYNCTVDCFIGLSSLVCRCETK
jgi:hypothetical protein